MSHPQKFFMDVTCAEYVDYHAMDSKMLLGSGKVVRESVARDIAKRCDEAEAKLKAVSELGALEEAKDVAMKATLCAQIMLQHPAVIANEKARHICTDTRDTANAFLAKHPPSATEGRP